MVIKNCLKKEECRHISNIGNIRMQLYEYNFSDFICVFFFETIHF